MNLDSLFIKLAVLSLVYSQRCVLEDSFTYCSMIRPLNQSFWSPSVVFCHDKCIKSRNCTGFWYMVDKKAVEDQQHRCTLYNYSPLAVTNMTSCSQEYYGFTWVKALGSTLMGTLCPVSTQESLSDSNLSSNEVLGEKTRKVK